MAAWDERMKIEKEENGYSYPAHHIYTAGLHCLSLWPAGEELNDRVNLNGTQYDECRVYFKFVAVIFCVRENMHAYASWLAKA